MNTVNIRFEIHQMVSSISALDTNKQKHMIGSDRAMKFFAYKSQQHQMHIWFLTLLSYRQK